MCFYVASRAGFADFFSTLKCIYREQKNLSGLDTQPLINPFTLLTYHKKFDQNCCHLQASGYFRNLDPKNPSLDTIVIKTSAVSTQRSRPA